MSDCSQRIKELLNNKDRISELPDEILYHILSFLTMVDAVATCILSPRWNGLWKHVSKDLFHHRSTTLDNYVTSAMLLHNPLNLEKFSLRRVDNSLTRDVIKNSIIKGIQYLDLFVKNGPVLCLPSNLFTSQTLEVLRLGGESILISVPNFVSLPNLRKIELVKVKYRDDESARILITSCVNLNLQVLVVELTKHDNVGDLYISSSTLRKIFVSYAEVIDHNPMLSGFSKKKNIFINAPPLQYLSLRDVSGSVYFISGNFPSLEEAEIDMMVSLSGRIDCPYCFCQAIKHVKVLTINEVIFKVPVSEHLFPMFHMLTVLKVTTSCCGWGMLENFLKNSPKLENLTFTVGSWSFHHHDLRWQNPESVPACLLSSLKSISIVSSTLYKVELAMAKYILKNARVLRTMKIKDHHSPGSKKEKKFHNVLLNVRRGSGSCEISIG